MPTFKMERDSLQDRFLHSTGKVQLFGGGFANGKTSAACVKAVHLARDYPGSNGLIARSTYPKLNDTIRKEFLKWIPDSWIESFPKSQNASNTCTLTNGTTINFRYIAQQGKSTGEATTSNLLSATYDWIIVDQIEDPEIVYKDFLDLLGRLRGMTPYQGDDPNMPTTGPRWFIVTTNPTRNWVYKELVKPVFDLQKGIINERLLCVSDSNGKPIIGNDRLPTPLIHVYEGSTYENAANLEPDFIQTLEASYRGQMRQRFLMGNWAAYEGLVYPDFDESVHVIERHKIEQYVRTLNMSTVDLHWVEGYDYGLAVPYCYLCGIIDPHGNFIVVDGLYLKEVPDIDEHAKAINAIRNEYSIPSDNHVYADPDIFRRKGAKGKLVGVSIAGMLQESGIYCTRGNNDIANGIVKVSQYLIPQRMHQNPITGEHGAPYMYISDHLEFLIDEFNGYYWKRGSTGEIEDKPIDKDDHGMDTLKYILSKRPDISTFTIHAKPVPSGWFGWGTRDIQQEVRNYRHA